MSDTSNGERPRPQYGEYASAAEQRARIQVPHPEDLPAQAPSTPPAPPIWGAMPASPARPAPGEMANRVITIGLLAYGAVSVVVSFFSLLDLATIIENAYRAAGIGASFANGASAHAWGIAAAIVLVVGFSATAWWAVHTMRRAKVSWWIPLVGAAVTYIFVSVCAAVPMFTDPALLRYITELS